MTLRRKLAGLTASSAGAEAVGVLGVFMSVEILVVRVFPGRTGRRTAPSQEG